MALSRRLAAIHSIDDFRNAAQAALPKMVFDFVDGGSESESTVRANRAALERLRLLPRGLIDVAERNQAVTLFGKSVASPIIIGPTGLASAFWPKADAALARAAGRAGIPFVMSTYGTSSMEDVIKAGDGRKWFQLYVRPTREENRALLERVAAAGFEALQVTIDAAVPSRRLRDLRNGFSASIKWTPGKVANVLAHPGWLWRTLRHGPPKAAAVGQHAPVGQRTVGQTTPSGTVLNAKLGWDDIAWMRDFWKGPLMIKGVCDPRQVAQAASLGLNGVVVSNHGGRQLDGAVGAVDMLPEAMAAAGKMTVLVDGGFRTGGDILKALALGASAVQIGRPAIYAVSCGGEDAVFHALSLLKAEIDTAQALLGLRSLSEIGPSNLWNPPHGR